MEEKKDEIVEPPASDTKSDIFTFGVMDNDAKMEEDEKKSLSPVKQESQTLFEQYVAFVKDKKDTQDSGRVSIEALVGTKQHRLIHRNEDDKIIFSGLILPKTSHVSQVEVDGKKCVSVDLGVLDMKSSDHVQYKCDIQFLE